MRGRCQRNGFKTPPPGTLPGAERGPGRGVSARCLSLLLLALCIAGAGCGKEVGKPARTRGPRDRLPRVEVVTPKRDILLRKIEVAANIEPLQRVELSARVAGLVRIDKGVDIG